MLASWRCCRSSRRASRSFALAAVLHGGVPDLHRPDLALAARGGDRARQRAAAPSPRWRWPRSGCASRATCTTCSGGGSRRSRCSRSWPPPWPSGVTSGPASGCSRCGRSRTRRCARRASWPAATARSTSARSWRVRGRCCARPGSTCGWQWTGCPTPGRRPPAGWSASRSPTCCGTRRRRWSRSSGPPASSPSRNDGVTGAEVGRRLGSRRAARATGATGCGL